MGPDLKSLEDKIGKLISLCENLRAENTRLRGDLIEAQESATTLKNNMLQASDRLEALLESVPSNQQASGLES